MDGRRQAPGQEALTDRSGHHLPRTPRQVGCTDLARAAGLDASPEIIEGTYDGTWHAIVEAGLQQGAAVIVVGARGLSTFQSFVLGSVSHGVAQHSRVPVLIVPPAPS